MSQVKKRKQQQSPDEWEPLTERIDARLSRHTVERLRDIARAEEISVAALVRRAVREFLREK